MNISGDAGPAGATGGEVAIPQQVPWSVVVPVKSLRLAKTRLAPLGRGARQALALAMALDTVAAAVACTTVVEVLVVTNDDAAAEFSALGATVVADEPDSGLNLAISHGAATTHDAWPHHAVAALAGDLPALQPDELAVALTAATPHPRAVVADSSGEGTVLLTARPGFDLAPDFGPGSLARHRLSGAAVITAETPGLRRDVDTLEDLYAALDLGCGPRTMRAAAPALALRRN